MSIQKFFKLIILIVCIFSQWYFTDWKLNVSIDKLQIHANTTGLSGDGKSDDTLAFKKLLDSYDIVKLPKGEYVITDDIYLRNGQHIIGEEAKIIIKKEMCSIRGNKVHNINISGVEIVLDSEVSRKNQCAIKITESENILIDNITVRNFGGDGIALINCKDAKIVNTSIYDCLINLFAYQSSNILFENCYSYGGKFRYNVQFKSCWNSIMRNIIVENGSEISVFVSKESLGKNPQAITPRNIKIENVTVINHGIKWNEYEQAMFYVENWRSIENKSCYAVNISGGYNYTIRNIDIKNSYSGGIRLNICDADIDTVNIDGFNYNTKSVAFKVEGKNCKLNNINLKNGTGKIWHSNLYNSRIENLVLCENEQNILFDDKDTEYINVILGEHLQKNILYSRTIY